MAASPPLLCLCSDDLVPIACRCFIVVITYLTNSVLIIDVIEPTMLATMRIRLTLRII